MDGGRIDDAKGAYAAVAGWLVGWMDVVLAAVGGRLRARRRRIRVDGEQEEVCRGRVEAQSKRNRRYA